MIHHIDERALVQRTLPLFQENFARVVTLALLVVQLYHLVDLLAGGLDHVELLVHHGYELYFETVLVQRAHFIARCFGEFGLSFGSGEAVSFLQEVVASVLS